MLSEEQKALTKRARAIASQVEGVEVKEDNLLEDILADDQSTFSIVVAGEFNSGKSTLINALLGTKLLETGALPTTDSIILLTHGETNSTEITNAGEHFGVVIHKISDVPLLQDLTFVDTPGTNAVVLNHTARTMKLLPSADLILFVTSADRPFPESERAILKSIQAYRKHIVVVLNKMDVLETAGGNYGEEEKRRVVEFVSDNASELLGARPIVIPISARDAISTKLTGNDDESGVWRRSNFAALESFLKNTLTAETKVKAKLTNPIGISEGMMLECLTVLKEERKDLGVDISTLNLLQSQFTAWEKSMNSEVDKFRRDVRSVLMSEGERCRKLVRRMNLFDWYMFLLDESRFLSEWRRTKRIRLDSLRSVEDELLNLVEETADSLATSARTQGQAVIEYLGKRPAIKSQSLVGSVSAASKFDETKGAMLNKMSDAVTNVLSEHERDYDDLSKSFKQVVLLSTTFQLGAAGIAIMTATSFLPGVSGMSGSCALAASGAILMMHGTQRVSSQYQEIWQDRQCQLDEVIEAVSLREIEKIDQKVRRSIAPYTRFVEAEEARILSMTLECEAIRASAQALRQRISKLYR
jgi:small GTP-binding protein